MNTQFGGLVFSATAAGPFTITGNTILLNGNITDSTQSFTQTISLPLALQTTPTVNITSFGSLTISGIISGGFGLNETGSGLLTLSGTNTFTGPVSIASGATLSISADSNLGAIPGSATPGDLVITGGGTLKTSATITINANRGIGLGPGTGVFDTASGTTLTYNGILSNNGGAGGFAKLSFGNMTLGGANTYTGPTVVKNGTLTLDFTQASAPVNNIINSVSALTLGGANAGLGNTSYDQLIVQGKASTTNNQSFSGTTIDVGPAVIRANSGTSGTANLNLGNITLNKGGIATFILPTAGNINTTLGNTNGILGAWATVGNGTAQNNVIYGTDWASVDGSGNVKAYTGYTAWSSGTVASNSFPTSSNLQVTNGASLAVAADNANVTVDVNTLALKNTVTDQAISVGVGNTLRFGPVGGIFRQDSGTNLTFYVGETGATQHNQGFITAGGADNTPGTLVVTVDANSESAGALRLGAILKDNGTGKLTFVKAGPGNLKIDGLNTFTGDSYLLQGRTQMSGGENSGTNNPTALGVNNRVFISPGAMLLVGGFSMTNDMFIAGIGTNAEAIGALRFAQGTVMSGTLTLTGDARIGDGKNISTNISGKITGNFNLDMGSAASTGGGAGTEVPSGSMFTISNPANDWGGNTTILGRTGSSAGNTVIHLGNNDVIPNGIGKGNLIMGLSGDTTSTEILNLNGHNETVNGVITPSGVTASLTFIENRTGSATFTLGDNNQTSTFNGILRDNGGTLALTKIGTGVQTLGGTNTYTGATNINGGALSIMGSLSSSGALNINTSVSSAGALYGGTTVTPGSVGSVTLAGAVGLNKAVINPGITGAGSIGTVSMTGLTVGAGSDLQFDLGGAGNSDRINVSGTATFSGAWTVTPSASSSAGSPYTVLQAASMSGPAPTLVSTSDTRLTYAIDPASYNGTSGTAIIIDVSGSAASLAWTGAGDGSTWDLHNTPNWTSTALTNPNLYFNGDSVTFDDSGIANNTISLGVIVQPGSVTVSNTAGAYTFTSGGSIAGGGSLTKNGAGTLTITTNNSYSGGTTLNAGTLNVNTNTALGTGPITINGGTLGNTSGQAVAVPGNPAQTWGGGDIVFNGPNDLNLGAGAVASTTSGATRNFNIIAGTLTIGGTVTENTSNVGINKIGGGTLALNGDSTFTGATVINAGTLKVGSSASLGGAVVINATPVTGSNQIALPSTSGLSVGIGISGAGIPVGSIVTAIDVPSNTITISNNATANNAADLTFATNTSAITVADGAALDVGGSTAANSIVIGPRPVTITGSGVGSTGALTNSGTVAQQNAFQNVTLASDATIGGTGRFDIRGPATTLTLGGHTLTKTGTNFVALANTTVSNGNIVVSQGTLELNGATSVLNNNDGTSIKVTSGATLQFFALTGTVSRPIIMGDPATISDGSGAGVTSTVASNITLQDDVTLNGGNATANLILSGTLTETGGARSITKTGAGTVSLGSTANNFSGPINLNGGLLNFAALGSLGTGTQLNFAGGGLQYASSMASPPDLSTRTMTFNTGGGTIDTTNNTVTFANSIGNGGVGGFTKAGTGTLTLNAASNYTGNTTVGNGVLVLGAAGAFPNNTALTMGDANGNNGTLDLAGHSITVTGLSSVGTSSGIIGSSTQSVTLTYAGTGTSAFNGSILDSVNGGSGQTLSLAVTSGKLILTGSEGYSGPTTISAGATLQLGNGAPSISLGTTTITDNGTLAFGASSLSFTSNPISGSGSVMQTGAGTMTTLGGSNNYTGGTVLQGGTLGINSDAAINNGVGGVQFTGGTLQFNGYSSNLSFTSGNVRLGSLGTSTLNGSINTSGSFTYAGSGTLTLAGSVTYTGATSVQAGTLVLGAAASLPVGTSLSLGDANNDSPILDLNGHSITVSALSTVGAGLPTIGSSSTASNLTITYSGSAATTSTFGGVIQDVLGGGNKTTALTVNSGNLTLTFASTYSGPTTINAGAKLTLSGVNGIANTSSLTLNGGTFATGGNPQSMPTTKLNIQANSTIDLGAGAGAGIVQLNNSADQAWNGAAFLRINNWSGTVTGGGTDQVNVGVGGLSSAQLSNIHFTNYLTGATILGSGEVVPSGAAIPTGDVNLDTHVDIADVSAQMTALSDLAFYQTFYQNSHPGFDALGVSDVVDVNRDGFTNNRDVQSLIVLLANGGGSAPGGGSLTAVPEPSSIMLVGLGCTILFAARVRKRLLFATR